MKYIKFESLKKHKNFLFGIYLLVAFLIVVAIWYTPIVFKGYPAVAPAGEEIVLGRNFAQSGVLGMENKLNVVVAPDKLNEAQGTALGNKFTAYSYALIFKIFGWQSWDRLTLMAVLLYALGTIFFTLTVYHLFGLRAAVLFPLVYALLPFMGETVQFLGIYEFALFYFAVFTFLYFWGRDQKYKLPYLILAGIFLALACLAREAMFVFLPIFFFWLLFKKINFKESFGLTWRRKWSFLWQAIITGYKENRKELLTVFIPVAIFLIIFWLPSFFGVGGSNDYLRLFVASNNVSTKWSEFTFYGHIYPDPYTFHFNAGSVRTQLEKDLTNNNSGFFYIIDRLKVAKNMGIKGLNILNYFIVGTSNLAGHISKFFAIEFIGGPIIFLLMLVGFWQLKRQNRELYYFFAVCLIATVLILSYVVLALRSHMMDFGWIIAAVVSIGAVSGQALIARYYKVGKYSNVIFLFFIGAILYSLVLAGHVYWGRSYDNSANPAIRYIAEKTSSQKPEIKSGDIIAVGNINLHPFLNYLTGKSVVLFTPKTVAKLIEKNKLQWAFDQFGIKYIAGFSRETSDEIIKNSQVKNIADWPNSDQIQSPVSFTKSWILNIIK